MAGKFTDVLLSVIVLAGITTLLLPGRATGAAKIITAGGQSFSGVIKAATGQR